MRFECALLGILAVAGCSSQRGYTANCPHCNQAHTLANTQAAGPSSQISPVTFSDANAPMPSATGTVQAYAPVPAVPGIEE